MTLPLPLLLAQASLSESSSITFGLALSLFGAIVLGVWWGGREFQRGVERDRAIAVLEAGQEALAKRSTALELKEARTDQRLDQLFDMMTRIETKLDKYFEQQHSPRRSA